MICSSSSAPFQNNAYIGANNDCTGKIGLRNSTFGGMRATRVPALKGAIPMQVQFIPVCFAQVGGGGNSPWFIAAAGAPPRQLPQPSFANMANAEPRSIPGPGHVNDKGAVASFSAAVVRRPPPQCQPPMSQTPTTFATTALSLSSASTTTTADNRKRKTELCTHFLKSRTCPYGQRCNFAHGERDRVRFETANEMMAAGVIADAGNYMCRPCSIFISTGACPYDNRCKFLHDPTIRGPSKSWLEHCTKSKKRDPTIIPDRLYHHRIQSIHQKNPLVAPLVWENCRPSSRAPPRANSDANANTDADANAEADREWKDTYDLVCNREVPVFGNYAIVVQRGSSYTRTNRPKMTELQKLCVVRAMGDSSDSPLDFTYSPTHTMLDQPCMVLQTRYFRLLNPSAANKDRSAFSPPSPPRLLSHEDIVEEITHEEYHGWRPIEPRSLVCAREVAFDSRGKRSANLSIWFDVDAGPCSNNRAKKMTKKGEDHWRGMPNANGALFCMPKSDDFELRARRDLSDDPHVLMQPVADSGFEGRDLMRRVLDHRVAILIRASGFRYKSAPYGAAELDQRRFEIRSSYHRMADRLRKWSWPKTDGMEHITKVSEERNGTRYRPVASEKKGTVTTSIWESFTANLEADRRSDDSPSRSNKPRLPFFRSIRGDDDNGVNASQSLFNNSSPSDLPRISDPVHPPRPNKKRQPKPSSLQQAMLHDVTNSANNSDFFRQQPQCHRRWVQLKPSSSDVAEATWKELLLGREGPWARAIQAHAEKEAFFARSQKQQLCIGIGGGGGNLSGFISKQ